MGNIRTITIFTFWEKWLIRRSLDQTFCGANFNLNFMSELKNKIQQIRSDADYQLAKALLIKIREELKRREDELDELECELISTMNERL